MSRRRLIKREVMEKICACCDAQCDFYLKNRKTSFVSDNLPRFLYHNLNPEILFSFCRHYDDIKAHGDENDTC